MGLSAQDHGATTPEAIYQYLMGAYFGGKEMPWYRKKAGKFNEKLEKQAQTGPELNVTSDPSLVKGWRKLDPIVQKEVYDLLDKSGRNRLGDTPDEARGQAYKLMYELGILDKIPESKDINTKGFKELNEVLN